MEVIQLCTLQLQNCRYSSMQCSCLLLWHVAQSCTSWSSLVALHCQACYWSLRPSMYQSFGVPCFLCDRCLQVGSVSLLFPVNTPKLQSPAPEQARRHQHIQQIAGLTHAAECEEEQQSVSAASSKALTIPNLPSVQSPQGSWCNPWPSSGPAQYSLLSRMQMCC